MDTIFGIKKPSREELLLLKELNLPAWNAKYGQETLVGTVIPYKDEQPEGEQTKIQIFVTAMPATFFRFVVDRKSESEDYDGMERVEVTTGSGSLATFWPMAMAVADCSLSVSAPQKINLQ